MFSCRARYFLQNAFKIINTPRLAQVRSFSYKFPLFSPSGQAALRSGPSIAFQARTHALPSLKTSSRPTIGFFVSNSTTAPAASLPPLSPPSVGYWLLFSSALVFGVVVVGGITRLTESGLSITEWKPITGIIPPLNQADWDAEFEKYKATPEFKLLNQNMTSSEFKRIYYWEYGHRVLGRIIGVAFVLPYVYFLSSKSLTRTLPSKLGALAGLIGFQGILGWYMVKSGLQDSLMDTPGAVPRVSQYRLAAHLGTAILLYAGMIGIGASVLRDWTFAKKGTWNGVSGDAWQKVSRHPAARRFATAGWVLTGLVFITALSGAFVAGLDAGLVYNEFPTMGGRLAPPRDELFSPAYAKNSDMSDLWWRNLLENPTTVQFNHRVLAITTYIGTSLFFALSRPLARRGTIPPITRKFVAAAFAAANVQVLLGLSTLLYLVPIPIAAAHQAGSIALLTCMIAVLTSLRQPGHAAKLWRNFYRSRRASSQPS